MFLLLLLLFPLFLFFSLFLLVIGFHRVEPFGYANQYAEIAHHVRQLRRDLHAIAAGGQIQESRQNHLAPVAGGVARGLRRRPLLSTVSGTQIHRWPKALPLHIHGNGQRLGELEGEVAGRVRGITLGSRTCLAPSAGATLTVRGFHNHSERLVAALGVDGQRVVASLARILRGRLHGIAAGGQDAVHDAGVRTHAAIVVLAVLVAQLAVPAGALEEIEVWVHIRRQFNGNETRCVHGEGV